jgi:TetR/AcrR family transcriptional regulator, cholesterol catabolism regulator
VSVARVRDDVKYAEQRTRILEATAKLFRSKGYDNTTMGDVAAALDVTKAALYYYFPSKSDLLLEICETAIDSAIEATDDTSVESEPADARLRHVVSNLIRTQNENFEAFAVFFEEESIRANPRYKAINTKREDFGKTLEEILAAGVREGIFHSVNIRLTTLAIVGMCQWTHRWYRAEKFSTEEISKEFIEFVERALKKKY